MSPEHRPQTLPHSPVRTAVRSQGLNLRTDFADFGASFTTPGEHQGPALAAVLGQLVSWSGALAGPRTAEASTTS